MISLGSHAGRVKSYFSCHNHGSVGVSLILVSFRLG